MDRKALWDQVEDEAVEVNQRALIDKILARYSGKFTVFRELLQNADDAGAKRVRIHFETEKYLQMQASGERPASVSSAEPGTQSSMDAHDIPYASHQDVVVSQWRVWNDGAVFRDEDWKRLKKIADGNPDEHKIGAFGVGFYSLFSVTEEPFVTSGPKWMGFHWKDGKDQLMARRGNLPEISDRDLFTTFTIPLRQPGPLPDAPLSIIRFLASALPFMNTLATFELFLDGILLASLQKNVDPLVNVDVPVSLAAGGVTKWNRKDPISNKKWDWWTPRRFMNVHCVTCVPMHINASVVPWVYQCVPVIKQPTLPTVDTDLSDESDSESTRTQSPPLDGQKNDAHQGTAATNEATVLTSSVTLNLFTADASVQLDHETETFLERAMQKKSPKSVKVGLLYTTYDGSGSIQSYDSDGIFSGVRANLKNPESSRIYIGHATGQTTGIAGHISSRFIPTVEREAIDLVDQNVSVWNKELLHIGGYLSRVVYETELSTIHTERKICNAERSSIASLERRYLHLIRFFAFYPSTPASGVSEIMQTAFYGVLDDILVLATSGVMLASKVRILDPGMDGFMKSLPLLPKLMIKKGGRFMDTLRKRRLVRGVTPDEVTKEMNGRTFTEEEMMSYIKWRSDPSIKLGLNTQEWKRIGNVGRFSTQAIEGTKGDVNLKEIKTYIDPDADGPVPREGPFPRSMLPPKLSRIEGVRCTDYYSLFGWRLFSLKDWIAYLCDQSSPLVLSQNITRHPSFAERVLSIVANNWSSLSQSDQTAITQSLSKVTCIPTQLGLKQPKFVYFFAKHIFDDLPMVTFLPPVGPIAMAEGVPIASVLDMLGVQRHVDLQLVFERMIGNGSWTIPQLTKYLLGVRHTLTPKDIDWLREKEAFRSEGLATYSGSRKAKLCSLYEPRDETRELGLPLLDWQCDHSWNVYSTEAAFLISLGLQRHPGLYQLLKLANGPDKDIREKALKYLFNYRESTYPKYRLDDYNHIAFVPAIQPNGSEILARRDRVFLNQECAMLGFDVVRRDIIDDAAHHLNISRDPPVTGVIEKLASGFLAKEAEKLSSSFVAVEAKARAIFKYLSYYAPTEKFRELQEIKFIPVRNPRSNVSIMVSPNECFFRQGGSWTKDYPNIFTLVDFGLEANHFLEKCGVRRDASVNDLAKRLTSDPQEVYRRIGNRDRFKEMLKDIADHFEDISPDMLLEMKRKRILLDDETVSLGPSGENMAPLFKADEIIIIDDMGAYAQFREHIRAAPRKDALEKFYARLGSPRLSQLISEEYIPNFGNIADNNEEEIRQRILTRLWFFFEGDMKQKARTQVEWMEDPRNFMVKKVQSLSVKYTFRWKGEVKEQTPKAASGCSRGIGGQLTLYIAQVTWRESVRNTIISPRNLIGNFFLKTE
ncbi:hypothetical protein M408DRAFT_112189 [Serendipita vermifera MAFF 305830]|uniref:Sacsin/Nov domain-containing protein n=1 Tax=Serendipita vermifera MAFF 305830 TaxID=933852 RepID=A0A0C3AP83_SERVB|nr:hypothetical protein M408DRAFT_112189 [Serendipita vermifera MAFF 305830]